MHRHFFGVSVSINFYIILSPLQHPVAIDLSLFYCCIGEKVFDNTSLNLQFMVLLDLRNSFKDNQVSCFDFSLLLLCCKNSGNILLYDCLHHSILFHCRDGMTTDFGSALRVSRR